jgi:hypothetical protein
LRRFFAWLGASAPHACTAAFLSHRKANIFFLWTTGTKKKETAAAATKEKPDG